VAAFDSASGDIERRFVNPFWKLTRIVAGSSLRRKVAIVSDFGIRRIRSRLENKASLNLLDDLCRALGQDEKLAADAALNFLSAGRDTVFQSILWTLYELLKHPSYLRAIRSEVNQALGPDPSVALLTDVTLDASILPLTHAIFHEGLRLHPPIPIEIRQAQTDYVFPDSLTVPALTLVIWSPYAFGRDPALYGADADVFRPERWLDEKRHMVNRSAAEYPVFNGGARNCLGRASLSAHLSY
jgi:cytochrome P450